MGKGMNAVDDLHGVRRRLYEIIQLATEEATVVIQHLT